jgi:Holliday junction resolvasome RuvABC ATP-dependent DNA helicase subunit
MTIEINNKPLNMNKIMDKMVPKVEKNFWDIVGNTNPKMKLAKLALHTLCKRDRNCGGNNILITGPASTGKTYFVSCFTNTLRLPTLNISPVGIKSLVDLVNAMRNTLKTYTLSLVRPSLQKVEGSNILKCPPMVIFMDEAHALKPEIQDGLLKAIEANDRKLVTEDGTVIDCSNVCWIFATTDAAKLLTPLVSRFTVLELKPYTKIEIAMIVHRKYKDKLTPNICKLIAHYENKIPRKAIAFAKDVVMLKEMFSHMTWEECCKDVAKDNGIDEYGLHENHLKVIKLLAKGPISKDRLAMSLQLGKEEAEKMIMSPILSHTDDNPALVTVCSKGYCLTEAGKDVLAVRNVPFVS